MTWPSKHTLCHMIHQNTQSLPVAFPGHSWAQGREEEWGGRNRPYSHGAWLTLSECSPIPWHMTHPIRVLPPPHRTWFTLSECSPVPWHMAYYPVRVLLSPTTHDSPCQSAPQSRSTWITMSECSPVPQQCLLRLSSLSFDSN